jgi:hypothetical protein
MRETGLDYLGAEQSAGDKTIDVIKKVGPGLVSAITDAFDSKKAPSVSTEVLKQQLAAASKQEKSWFTKPALGPIPGWGVAVGGVGLLAGLGFAIRAIAKR